MKNGSITKKFLLDEFEKLKAENKRLKQANKKYLSASQMIEEANTIDGLRTEIENRKIVEEQLRESEERYRELFESNPHPMWVYELSTLSFLAVNDAAVEKYQYSKEEFLNMTIADIRPKEDIPKLLKSIPKKDAGIDKAGLWHHRKKDGTIIDVEIISHTLTFNNKDAELVIAHDLTEKIRTEDALKLSESRFKGVINSIQDLVYTLDRNQKITGLYGMWSEMYGFTEEEFLGKKLTMFLSHPETTINEIATLRALNGEAVKFEWSLKRNDDNFNFESSLTPIFGNTNDVIGVVGVARDISERKRSELRLRESEERYRKLFDFSPDPIFVHKDGIILFINSAGLKLFAAKREEQIIGKNILEFVHPDFRSSARERIVSLQNGTDKLQVVRKKFIRLDDAVIDVEVSTISFSYDGEIAAQVVVRDITEKMKAEKQIRLQAELLNSANDSIFLIDKNGYIVYANKAALQQHGYTDEEILVMRIQDLDVNENSDFTHVRLRDIYEKGFGAFEVTHSRKDKSTFPAEVNAQLIIIDNEKYVLSVERDITERVQTHAELIQSEGKFRSIFESASVAILILGLDHKILQANHTFSKMLGYTQEEVLGKSILDLTYEEDRSDSYSKLGGLVHKSEKVNYLEKRYYSKNGKLVWGIASGTVIKDDKGNPLYVVGLIQDITDRVKANENLRKISSAVEQSSSSIIITDLKGSIEYVNPKFTQVTGFTSDEALGKNPRVLKSGKQTQEFYENMWNTISSGREWQGEFHNRKKSGQLFWEHASISPIKNEAGKITHYLSVKEDITEWKNVQEELIRSKEEAVEASKLKSSLLANMSHEFRTPLNGVLGFAQLLKEEVADSSQLDMVDKIIQSGRRLMNTLNSVLMLTELENNNYLINKSEIDLVVLCQQLKMFFVKPAQNKNLEFILDLKEENFSIFSDENLLTRVISSFIENAIKYTHAGGIKIELTSIYQNNGKRLAVINIIDTGIGIRTEDQSLIFREFKQLSEGFRRDFEGLGLGLTIANKIMNLIGGTITLQSELGKGSKFTLMIPVETPQKIDSVQSKQIFMEKEMSPITKPPTENELANVLLIEDNPLNIEVVQKFLSKICTVSFAREGLAAIKMADEHDYSLVMIDINLGQGIDGVQVLHEIKKLGKYDGKPIIALTGYASDTNKKEFLAHGFTHYLAKPFDKRELIKLVMGILNLE
ncbi:MAG: PAS domain S-box protein [Ignavibacteriales bacterium]|nr:PAS domain S-box protein [Ignavibacteriales bacterium]